MLNRELLVDFIREYPAQPATAFWRAIEIDALVKFGLPDGRGLDLGCGDGKLTEIILRQTGARRLVGVDIDPLETEAARRYPFYEAVHTAPGGAVPEPDGSFDFVLANSVLEHIPELEPVIAEVGRLLRPGGRFVCTVPAPHFEEALRGSLLPWVSRARYLEELNARIAHANYLSSADWRALAGRHGLRVTDALGYLDDAEVRRWESLSRVTGGLLYRVAGREARPIEIQRRLGLRQLQNRVQVPEPVARLAGGLLGAGVAVGGPDDAFPWLDEAQAGCLLVAGERV